MSRPGVFFLLAILPLLSSSRAGAAEHRHRIVVGGQYVAVSGTTEEQFDLYEYIEMLPADLEETVVSRLDAEDATGWFLAYEVRAGRRLGFEVSVGASSHDLEGPVTGTATLDPLGGPVETVPITGSIHATLGVRPIAIAAHWHFSLGRRGEFALGPVLSRIRFEDLRIDRWTWTASFPANNGMVTHHVEAPPLPVETDVAFGLTAGVEIPLGAHGWGFAAGATYLPAEADFEATGAKRSIGLDPLFVRVAISKSFGSL